MLERKGSVFKFIVYGDPVAQGRPRFTTKGGKARAYDPQKSSDFKEYVALVASQHRPKELLTGALELTVIFYRPLTKVIEKSEKKMAEVEAGTLLPITKPDVDNYAKGVKDALKGIIWKDDSQVTDLIARKRYSDTPRIEIEIWTVVA